MSVIEVGSLGSWRSRVRETMEIEVRPMAVSAGSMDFSSVSDLYLKTVHTSAACWPEARLRGTGSNRLT
jgi:hypothetical protein